LARLGHETTADLADRCRQESQEKAQTGPESARKTTTGATHRQYLPMGGHPCQSCREKKLL
jgi:hypothetical protein